MIKLPAPRTDGFVSVEKAIFKRRSVREFKKDPVTLEELSTLLWAAQGVTSIGGYRASPSAGGLYPLELYVAVGNVTGLPAGIYLYRPQDRALSKVDDTDVRAGLASAALEQTWVGSGAAMLVFAAVFDRTTSKYGRRGDRYVYMEVGHAAENVYLEAEALELGTAAVGAFDDENVKKIMKLKEDEVPLYILPVGRK